MVGAIGPGPGLLALVGVTHADDDAVARKLAERVWGLRVFNDEAGVMNLSAADVGAEVLVVSQFTLYGDTSRGRRPSWVQAARPEQAAADLAGHAIADAHARGGHALHDRPQCDWI